VFDKNSVRLIQRTTHAAAAAAAAKDVRGWLTALSAIMGRSAHNKIMYAALRVPDVFNSCVCFYGRHHRRPVKNRQRKSVHADTPPRER